MKEAILLKIVVALQSVTLIVVVAALLDLRQHIELVNMGTLSAKSEIEDMAPKIKSLDYVINSLGSDDLMRDTVHKKLDKLTETVRMIPLFVPPSDVR